MLQFQPPGFEQRVIKTSLGIMAYYTPIAQYWQEPPAAQQNLPALVFLHSLGGGSSAYEWSKVYPAFAATHRVIAPDLIGWGQSTHPALDYRAADYLRVLTELLESIAGPVPIVASSLTAGLVVRLAVQRPELFQQLFLVSPSGYADFGANYGQNLPAAIFRIPGIDRLIYRLGAANELAVRNFLEQFLFAERSRVTPEMVAAYLASAQQLQAEYAALASLRGDLCFDLAAYIPQLTVPTCLIWGEKSRFSKPSVGQRLAALNSRFVKFQVIKQAGVLPHLEDPAQTISLLQQTLHPLDPETRH